MVWYYDVYMYSLIVYFIINSSLETEDKTLLNCDLLHFQVRAPFPSTLTTSLHQLDWRLKTSYCIDEQE